MFGSARLKVPNGKLVMAKVRFGDRIESTQILGDFFMHPEEGIEKIEAAINGIATGEAEEEIEAAITNAAKGNGIEMVGVDPGSIAMVVKEAIKNGMESPGA